MAAASTTGHTNGQRQHLRRKLFDRLRRRHLQQRHADGQRQHLLRELLRTATTAAALPISGTATLNGDIVVGNSPSAAAPTTSTAATASANSRDNVVGVDNTDRLITGDNANNLVNQTSTEVAPGAVGQLWRPDADVRPAARQHRHRHRVRRRRARPTNAAPNGPPRKATPAPSRTRAIRSPPPRARASPRWSTRPSRNRSWSP